jgi:predicted nucleic acid-binding protein
MPKPRVYIETTIPSAYYTGRTDPETIKRHVATRRWWDLASRSCEMVTSDAVREELARGTSVHVRPRLQLIKALVVLDAPPPILAAASVYITQKLMPADPLGDALHLALASHHKCDVLLTWNYLHLANRTELDRIKRLNDKLGLFVPRLAP